MAGESLDFYLRANRLSYARLGLAVPKKAIRQAVARNRIKRLLREYFRDQQTHLTGYDLVIVVKKKMSEHDNAQQAEVISAHWQNMMERLSSCKPSSSS